MADTTGANRPKNMHGKNFSCVSTFYPTGFMCELTVCGSVHIITDGENTIYLFIAWPESRHTQLSKYNKNFKIPNLECFHSRHCQQQRRGQSAVIRRYKSVPDTSLGLASISRDCISFKLSCNKACHRFADTRPVRNHTIKLNQTSERKLAVFTEGGL